MAPMSLNTYKKGNSYIITNDAWTDTSQGHKQHLSLARLRAIENRRGIARSANTGFQHSLMKRKPDRILAYGKNFERKIPQNTETTYYTDNDDYIFRVAMFTLLLMLFTSSQGENKIKKRHYS